MCVTLDVAAGCFRFEWHRAGSEEPVARGRLGPSSGRLTRWFALELELETTSGTEQDSCGSRGTSPGALVNRLRKRFPVPDDGVQVRVLSDTDIGPAKAGVGHAIQLPPSEAPWRWLGRAVHQFCGFLEVVDGDRRG